MPAYLEHNLDHSVDGAKQSILARIRPVTTICSIGVHHRGESARTDAACMPEETTMPSSEFIPLVSLLWNRVQRPPEPARGHSATFLLATGQSRRASLRATDGHNNGDCESFCITHYLCCGNLAGTSSWRGYSY
jgi:hypothetical protein